MSKSSLTIGSIAFVLIGWTVWFFLLENKAGTNGKLRFEHHPTLTEEHISDRDYQALIKTHQDCFEDTRKKQLAKYYIEAKGLDENLVEGRVRKDIQRARMNAHQNFRFRKNFYTLHSGDELIGLYNCRDEDELTENSIMIYNVCLKSSMRRKGFGRKLMLHAIDKCRKPDQNLSLTVYKDDPYVVEFYKKLHFKIIEPQKEVEEGFDFFNKYLMIYTPKKPDP